jgi:hypothetical protein
VSERHLRPDRPHRPLTRNHSNPELDEGGRFGRNPADEHGEAGGEGQAASLLAERVPEPVPNDWEFGVTGESERHDSIGADDDLLEPGGGS